MVKNFPALPILIIYIILKTISVLLDEFGDCRKWEKIVGACEDCRKGFGK
jgi:hypothetical protein